MVRFGELNWLAEVGWQIYMERRTTKNQEKGRKWRKRQKNINSWMSKYGFDSTIKRRIEDHIGESYESDDDVYVETLIPDLPPELRSAVSCHICLKLLKEVSFITFINLLNNCLSHAWWQCTTLWKYSN